MTDPGYASDGAPPLFGGGVPGEFSGQLVLLHRMVDSLPEMVMACDIWGQVIYANPATIARSGYPSEEIPTVSLDILFDLTDEDKLRLQRCMDSRDAMTLQTQAICRCGRMYPVHLSASPLTNGDQVDGLVVMAVDMSQLKPCDAEVRKLTENLESRVAERTAELQNVTHELQAFCRSVSHDLRAPLRAIDSFARILRQDHLTQLDPQGQDFLNRVQLASAYMTELFDGLVAMSRLDQQPLVSQPVDLTAMAKRILDELRAASPQRCVRVTVDEGLSTFGDPRLLEIVLRNLLDNAWKFTSRTTKAVIAVGRQNVEGHLAFVVRDNGAGFDAAYVDRLFAPFQRLHSRHEFDGTGLGLATVRRIITRHGGTIWASSVPMKGATFYFTLNATQHAE